ncbi:MAG: phospholipase D-like domain-containing protein [Acidobacteriota bacterium]|nr:phospholipase D-like domain-containing protein [Acidobacteriota bacterium]
MTLRYSRPASLALAFTLLLATSCQSPLQPQQAVLPVAEPGKTEEHFSPAENIEAIDREHLLRARKTIDIAMYSFTDLALAEAVAERAQAGVKVRIYRDHDQYAQELSRKEKNNPALEVLENAPNLEMRVKGTRELMHLKAYAIDGTELRTGSANWSPTGEKRQDNNAHFTTDPTQVKLFEKNFATIWERDNNQKVR